MYVNNNLAALNAWGNLLGTENNLNTSIARLSSGQQINTAADGPAAYAIIQQMQGQTNGLSQANKNSQDGISLIQTAEGALNQTENILQSMRTLAVQAASDTQTPSQRADIQQQVDQFAKELTQIANTTQYNTMPLLAGLYGGGSAGQTVVLQVGANQGQTISFNISAMDASSLGVARTTVVNGLSTAIPAALTFATTLTLDTVNGNGSIDLTATTYEVNVATAVSGGTTYTIAALVNASGTTIGSAVTITSSDFQNGATSATIVIGNGQDGQALDLAVNTFALGAGAAASFTVTMTDTTSTGPSVANGSMQSYAQTYGGISVSNQQDAENAITTLDTAISQVSSSQGILGAMQDRLQFVMSNVTSASENLTSAQTRIQSTDMAKEMATFSEQQVLLQSGMDMLYQANQIPSNILTLLR